MLESSWFLEEIINNRPDNPFLTFIFFLLQNLYFYISIALESSLSRITFLHDSNNDLRLYVSLDIIILW